MDTLGKRILWIIDRLGTNQSGLAQIAGVTAGTVSTWVRSKHRPHVESIRRMADRLRIDPGTMKSFIVEGGEPPEPRTSGQDSAQNAPERIERALMSASLLARFARWCERQGIEPGEGFAIALTRLVETESAGLPARRERTADPPRAGAGKRARPTGRVSTDRSSV